MDVHTLLPAGPGDDAPIRPERLLSGAPSPKAWNLYTDPTEQFYAGQWGADEGAWHVVYEAHEEEFCVLLSGVVSLTPEGGQEKTYRAGDAFVVPGGFRGVWRNLTPVRKHYAIMHLKGC